MEAEHGVSVQLIQQATRGQNPEYHPRCCCQGRFLTQSLPAYVFPQFQLTFRPSKLLIPYNAVHGF